jgi:hypothetical protein
MSYVKIKDGEVTLNFKDAKMYFVAICVFFCVMLADNFVYNYYGDIKDHRLTTAAICCFVFAFIHLLYRFFPSELPKKVNSSPSDDVVTLPDKMFEHNDEASHVEVSMKRMIEKVPVMDDCTDDEDYDSSPKRRQRKSPRKEKKREVIEVYVRTWSKEKTKWQIHYLLDYCLSYVGYRPETIEIEKVQNSHKYIMN